MLTNITSLTGNGLKDWLIQRFSAVYLALYSLFLLGFIYLHPHLTYSEWHRLFHDLWFQTASVLALFLVTLHTWVGIWTVTTDYIKCTGVRLTIQMLIVLLLSGQFIWGLMIVWGQ